MEQYSPKTILLATEGSEGERAARAAIDLSKRTGAKLHAVLAWVPLPHFAHTSLVLERYHPPYEGGARRILDAQLGRIEQAGGIVSEAHLIEGRPAEPALEVRAAELEDACGVRPSVRLLEGESAKAVAEVAEEGGGTGLLVVGSRGLGTGGRMLLGSVSTKLVMAVSGPVLVCPREEGDEGGRRA